MITYPLNIKREEWINLSDKEQHKLIQDIIAYFREFGFPHFDYSLDEQHEEMKRLDKYMNHNDLEENKIIKQSMHCMGVCWSYHPHHWDIQCGNSKTPMQVFKNNDLLEKSIRKRMKSGSHINEAMMRKTFKVSGGAQTVSNFRPSVARWIYDKYSGEGYVFDPCMGFGGRLLGAISSPRVKKYVGVEPSTKTMIGLEKMTKNLDHEKKIKLNHGCAENVILDEKFDLSFTSPPYFNTEKYSDESTQSYKKFLKYEDWLNGFLEPMIDNSIRMLKDSGYFIINIANVKTAKNLEGDFQNIMKKKKMILVDTYKMSLSKQHSGGKFKYEPIFVYKIHNI